MRLITAALAILLLAAILSGCRFGLPCSDHGGVQWTNAKVYQCNDGTWE